MSTREIVSQQMKKKMNKWYIQIGGMVAALVLAGQAWAETAIRSISSGVQSGEIVVKVELTEPLTQEPKGFVIQNPPRIALDLPGVVNGMNRSVIDLSQGNLHSVAVAQANDRTRLVLNLGGATTYTTQIMGNTLLVHLAPVRPMVPANATEAVQFSPQTAQGTSPSAPVVAAAKTDEVQNIDFRTSADGAGSMIVTLPSDQTSIDIKQQGSNIVVELLQTKLPASLRKKLDVSDFRTPVKSIVAEQAGANVRLTISPTGNWEQSAFQAGNQFVLEVHPVKEDPQKILAGVGYKGERLTLNFQNIEIRALLNVIADFTDFNIVTSDSVRGNLTLRLKDVPWDQALDIIMQARGLAVEKTGNVLWIAPRDEINQMKIANVELNDTIEKMEPLRTQVFQLNYARVMPIFEAIKGDNDDDSDRMLNLLSERGSLLADERTNKLIVTDVPSRLEALATVLQQLDIPVRQVVIEARVITAEEGWGRSIGMRLTGIGFAKFNGNNLSLSGANPSVDVKRLLYGSDEIEAVGETEHINFFDFGAKSVLSQQPGYFSFGFSSGLGKYLDLEIQALEADQSGRNVASPRLMTSDSVKASVEQGVDIPYLEASSSGATSVGFKKAVLGLEVTPQITPDGNVTMDIIVTKDSRGTETIAGPAINTNRVETRVTIENGGTVVIGGIFTQDEKETREKIPLLGDIPLVGRFFRANSKEIERKELLIFVTPRIVNDGFARNPGLSSNVL